MAVVRNRFRDGVGTSIGKTSTAGQCHGWFPSMIFILCGDLRIANMSPRRRNAAKIHFTNHHPIIIQSSLVIAGCHLLKQWASRSHQISMGVLAPQWPHPTYRRLHSAASPPHAPETTSGANGLELVLGSSGLIVIDTFTNGQWLMNGYWEIHVSPAANHPSFTSFTHSLQPGCMW